MDEVIGVKSIREPILFLAFGSIFTLVIIAATFGFIYENGFVIPVLIMLFVAILFAFSVTIYGFKLHKRTKNLIILAGSTLLLTEKKKEILLSNIDFAEVYYRNPMGSSNRGNINGIQIKTKDGFFYHIPQLLDPIYVAKAINQRINK